MVAVPYSEALGENPGWSGAVALTWRSLMKVCGGVRGGEGGDTGRRGSDDFLVDPSAQELVVIHLLPSARARNPPGTRGASVSRAAVQETRTHMGMMEPLTGRFRLREKRCPNSS